MFSEGQYGASIVFAITVVTSLAGLYARPGIIDKSLFRPYWFFRRREWDTLYMSGFVHANLGHLAMNMVTFYFFAFPLELRLGTVKFLLLYALGLVLSSVYTWWRHNDEPQYATLGASGAIAAVLFAYIVYSPLTSLFIIPIPVPIPAFVFAFCYLAYTYWAARQGGGRINHDAHLWGALSGLLFVLITNPSAYVDLLRQFS